jgi:hypothetical protein
MHASARVQLEKLRDERSSTALTTSRLGQKHVAVQFVWLPCRFAIKA